MYKTAAAAKRGLTMACKEAYKSGVSIYSHFKIAEASVFFKSIEKTETKRNLLSGKEFVQPVNTPLCCDPSSETYWSM
jgi:hypothetical protein